MNPTCVCLGIFCVFFFYQLFSSLIQKFFDQFYSPTVVVFSLFACGQKQKRKSGAASDTPPLRFLFHNILSFSHFLSGKILRATLPRERGIYLTFIPVACEHFLFFFLFFPMGKMRWSGKLFIRRNTETRKHFCFPEKNMYATKSLKSNAGD